MKADTGTTLLVDSGNLLFKTSDGANLLDQDVLAAGAILDIYRTIGYDALAVGPNDLAAGVELLEDSFQAGSPWISANFLTSDGSLVFPPWVIRQTPDGKVGILGLTAGTPLPEGYTIADWQDTLPKYLDMLFPACDFLILLSNLSSGANEEIAGRYPRIHLIVSSDQRKGNVSPLLVRNTLLTQTHTRGKYLGILTVNWPEPGIWQKTLTHDSEVLTDLLQSCNRQISILKKTPRRIDDALLARMHTQRSSLQDVAAGRNGAELGSWTFQFRAVTKNIQESAAINKKIAGLKKEIVEKNRKIQEGGVEMPLRTSLAEKRAGPQRFVGPETCGECHQKQHSQWHRTAHANSLQSLRDEQQQYNIRCLQCHVTRVTADSTAEAISGSLLNLPEAFQKVGCEACHGPGRAHVQSQGETALRPITEATCTACHTKDMDNTFLYQEKVGKLGCLK